MLPTGLCKLFTAHSRPHERLYISHHNAAILSLLAFVCKLRVALNEILHTLNTSIASSEHLVRFFAVENLLFFYVCKCERERERREQKSIIIYWQKWLNRVSCKFVNASNYLGWVICFRWNFVIYDNLKFISANAYAHLMISFDETHEWADSSTFVTFTFSLSHAFQIVDFCHRFILCFVSCTHNFFAIILHLTSCAICMNFNQRISSQIL